MSGLIRVTTGQGKVMEFWKKSVKFRILKKVRETCHWSRKFRGFWKCFIHTHDARLIGRKKVQFLFHYWDLLLGVLAEFHRDVRVINAFILPVLDVVSGQSWLMLGSSAFMDSKISIDSLKRHLPPVATLVMNVM